MYYERDAPNIPNGLLPQPSVPGGNGTTNSNDNSTEPLGVVQRMGLWDAGNFYLSKAFDLVNNGHNRTANGGNFSNWSSWKFVQDNGVSVIFPAYLATLDALVELTVAKSRSIYLLQLIVLCLEGGLLCILMCVYMWIVAHQYSHKRHDLYGVFLQIPIGVTRGLANMSLNLEAINQDESSDDDLNPDGATAGADGANGNANGDGTILDGELVPTAGAGGGGSGDRRAGLIVSAAATIDTISRGSGGGAASASAMFAGKRRTSLTFGIKRVPSVSAESLPDGANELSTRTGASVLPTVPAPAAGGTLTGGIANQLGALSNYLASLAIWRHRARITPHPSVGGRTKRRLNQSHKLAYWLVAPFIVWGAAIIAVNLVGYYHLKALTAPIATLNIVNVVNIRCHRIDYFVLEVASAMMTAVCQKFKSILAFELAALVLEYSAMLYGREVRRENIESTTQVLAVVNDGPF
ncbi:hypothetical protein Vafri_12708 [Volvox africanus]|uniref:Uncharacterized protein n=1 Tax=Volvox africanus TaxID=51714 RepID=A0A8J4F2X4_9CHLO|nr:hypothetical protein Vafri_12708 [Volvox africanus]